MAPAYQSSVTARTISDSPTCKAAFNSYNCVTLASSMGAAPCDAKGHPMMPCYDLCAAYVKACKVVEGMWGVQVLGGIATLPPSPKHLAFFPTRLQRLLSVSLCSVHFKSKCTKNDQFVLLSHEINQEKEKEL
jgi:hypothetical protein